MKTLFHFFDQKSHNTSNLRLKFWWWALETITHRFYYKYLHLLIYHGIFPWKIIKKLLNSKLLESQKNNALKFKILSRKNIQCNVFWENCNGKSAPNRLISIFRSFSKFKQATCVREKYVVRTSIRTNNERKKNASSACEIMKNKFK
jgi:hypothetical protein